MTTHSVRVFAPAKINLFLHVGDKRADGFHALQSLVVFAAAGDVLHLKRARRLSLAVEGPFAAALAGESDNLVLRAARTLGEAMELPLGAEIVLTKNLPVASGIGGGSADAAAALRGMARLWSHAIEPRLHELEALALARAAAIGSDVPVCVASRPAWMEGRGEVVTSAGILPQLPMVLVNPGVPVATAAIFRALDTRRGVRMEKPRDLHDRGALLGFLAGTGNDLEAPARALAPVIGEVLDMLASQSGVLLARMSGSGATCFALFDGEEASTEAARKIAALQPNWWVQPTRIAHDAIGDAQ